MGVPSIVALATLTLFALVVRFGPRGQPRVAPGLAERVALEWVGSGRVTHRRRARLAGLEVIRVMVRDAHGSTHVLDIHGHEGRVLDAQVRA